MDTKFSLNHFHSSFIKLKLLSSFKQVGVVTTPEGVSLPAVASETNARTPFVASLLQISG